VVPRTGRYAPVRFAGYDGAKRSLRIEEPDTRHLDPHRFGREALRRLGLFPYLLLDITQFLIPRIPALLGSLLTALATPLLHACALAVSVARPGKGVLG
jgi:hypothetical protein